MVCVYCGKNTRVINSRARGVSETWRRRACKSCRSIVTSKEQVQLDDTFKVEKRNNHIEPFIRDKLFLSIYRSVDHLDNPVYSATHLTATAIKRILNQKPLEPVIKSTKIASLTAKVLKNYNAAASVRYLSFQAKMGSPIEVRRSLYLK